MQIKFSEKELIDLLYAWAAISFSFAVLMSRQNFSLFGQNLLISGLTVGIAFLFHEISHKIVAQFFGCWAEFRKFDLGLIFAILMSFFGFVFAAPGAVLIFGFLSQRENGKIALAGPLANIVLALIFLFLNSFFLKFYSLPNILKEIFIEGFYINSWLAFFNLIPFPPLDGSKVISWSFLAWLFFTILATTLVFFLP